jgi:squalene synthase HpnC
LYIRDKSLTTEREEVEQNQRRMLADDRGVTSQRQPVSSPATRLAAREKGENFPVVLGILPARHRRALHAVYAFARTVDDLGDEADGDRTAQLRTLDDRVTRTWAGEHVADPMFAELGDTVVGRVPERYLHDLVHANLQDQLVHRYATFPELLDYCRLSAEPVGRIVLAVFDQHAEQNLRLSDRVCTALQLLEHWQDVAEDRRAGRVYLPLEDLTAFRVPETDLDAAIASPALARLMRYEVERAAGILAEGTPVVRRLRGWARCCVAGYVAGGRATVAALRRTEGDVLGRAPRPSRARTAAHLARLLTARPERGTS